MIVFRGYKLRNDSAKETKQEEIKHKTEVELKKTQHVLQEKEKQYYELKVRFTRQQMIALVVIGLYLEFSVNFIFICISDHILSVS